MANHPVVLAIVAAAAWVAVAVGCSADGGHVAPGMGGLVPGTMTGGASGAAGSSGSSGTPTVMSNGGTPSVTGKGGTPPITGNGGIPPITGNGGMPITATGGMPVTGTGGMPVVGTGGASGGTGTGGTISGGGKPPADKLPTVNGACPPMTTGTATVNGTPAHIWAGTKPGPAYIYWHATGTAYTEVMQGMPGATAGVGTAGGFVVSFDSTNSKGTNTGNNVWYTGDIESADQVLACAI